MATAASPSPPADRPGLLSLEAAALEIRQACDELGPQPQRTPFFFVVGAGISFPPVPLAAHIIEHCRKVAAQYKRDAAPGGTATLDAYSHWFSLAYPGARQRQEYLRSMIEHKSLSLSSLRLAHLLSARKLTNMVVTTNFDDFVSRGLRLFGVEPVVCDHPRTVGRIDRERADVQIVHVHGSYLFYDCANLRGEVTDRARPDEETSFTMVGLLDSLLWSRSPLVIGYSGWEGDVIMSALRRRLRGGNPLAQSVYWFCYRRSEIDGLPDWLRGSADVRFVVPPAAEPVAVPVGRGTPVRAPATPAASTPSEPTLPAVAVLDELNRAFEIGAPALFEDPIGQLARNLEASLPDVGAPAGDPYAFKALIERLRAIAPRYREAAAAQAVDPALDRLRILMRQSAYPEAAGLLTELIPARLGRYALPERQEIIAAARLVAAALPAEVPRGRAEAPWRRLRVFDAQLERALGPLPPGMAWLAGSRSGEYGFEMEIGGRPHGAFTYQLAESLADRAADGDKDGRISVLEAAIATGERLRRAQQMQTPAVAGDADGVALFGTRGAANAPAAPSGRLLALLVGVGRYKGGFDLRGPGHDVQRLREVLEHAPGRLAASIELLTMLDAQATASRMRWRLRGMCEAAAPQDTVLFYFSGHGMRREADGGEARGEVVLAAHDMTDQWRNVLTSSEVVEQMRASAARHKLVIVDF